MRPAPFSVSRLWRQAVDGCLARCRHFSKDIFFDLVQGQTCVTDQLLDKILSRLPALRILTLMPGFDLDVDIICKYRCCGWNILLAIRSFAVWLL